MKRLIDVVGASLAGLLLLPVLLLLALLIRVTMGPPIFFVQRRPGLGGRPFDLVKFRTMAVSRPEDPPRPDGERLTAVGRWLRATSLDELPELLNVVKGEMSLVGPRPLLMEYLPLYSERQARRHEVRPGLTGWAQVNGRNAISWEERLEMDVWYVEHQSVGLDLRILLRTVWTVLARRGVSHEGQATMEKFTGGSRSGQR